MLDLLKNPDHWKATRSREERYTFSVEFDFSPRYNIAPTQQVLTIGQTREGERKAATGAASASSCGGASQCYIRRTPCRRAEPRRSPFVSEDDIAATRAGRDLKLVNTLRYRRPGVGG